MNYSKICSDLKAQINLQRERLNAGFSSTEEVDEELMKISTDLDKLILDYYKKCGMTSDTPFAE